jgi:uncharacterized protein (TIGR03083 family)
MDLASLTDADRVDLLEQAFSSVDELCDHLDAADWDLPTDLPGWTVKDNLSHLVSFESAAIGRPHAPADIDVSRFPYIRNEFQAANEREVEMRRARAGAEVLAEYRDVIRERIRTLRELDQSRDATPDETPLGLTPPWRAFLPIRVGDFFYHEQDMRRAAGKPGHMNGAVAQMVFERVGRQAIARVIAKEAALPEGTTVAFDIEAPAEPFGITVAGERGVLIEPPSEVAVRIASDFEAWLCLVGGRWTVERAQGDGRLKIDGDAAIAKQLLDKIVVVP